jgi:hypothetical protein
MTTRIADEKARKLAARLEKRRAALVKAMRLDVLQLRKIIRRDSGEEQAGSAKGTS